jgi:hypothetical protein
MSQMTMKLVAMYKKTKRALGLLERIEVGSELAKIHKHTYKMFERQLAASSDRLSLRHAKIQSLYKRYQAAATIQMYAVSLGVYVTMEEIYHHHDF